MRVKVFKALQMDIVIKSVKGAAHFVKPIKP
jgi:hypothetical protein